MGMELFFSSSTAGRCGVFSFPLFPPLPWAREKNRDGHGAGREKRFSFFLFFSFGVKG